MKKLFKLTLALIASLILFQPVTTQAQSTKEITVTTTFLVDIVKTLAGDEVDVELIIPAGGDPHLYTASPQDLGKITNAELVFFHGLHFEAQLADVLESLDYAYSVSAEFNPDDLIATSEDSEEYDPHYWFDHQLYRQSVDEVARVLTENYPDLEATIEENHQAYNLALDDLEVQVQELVEQLDPEQRILITPHDAFTYFARQHGFEVHAPQGISTESEVSNEAISRTVNYIVEKEVSAIFLDTTSNPQGLEKLAEGVEQSGWSVNLISGEDQELFSDSLAAEGHHGDNYIDMYIHNVELIVNNLAE